MNTPAKGRVALPNGCTLYWEMDEAVGCRNYFSDAVGGGVHVWSTAVVDASTLLVAIAQEEMLRAREQWALNSTTEIPDIEFTDLFQEG